MYLHLLLRLISVLLFFYIASGAVAEVIYLTVEESIHLAEKSDVELSRLKFSLRKMAGSRIDIWKSVFPALRLNASGQKDVQRGEADSRSYTVGLSLEEALYNQLSIPVKFKEYNNSIEKLKLDISNRKREIYQKVMSLYLEIIYGREKNLGYRAKVNLYKEMKDLIQLEYKLGAKTITDLIEADKKLLEAKLKEEESSRNEDIAYVDLKNLLNIEKESVNIIVNQGINDLLGEMFKKSRVMSYDSLAEYVNSLISSQRESLYSLAFKNDFEIKKMKLYLSNNLLKRRISRISWLKNVTITCGVDFTGDRFFPVNRSYFIGANLNLDFGLVRPDVSLSSGSSSGGQSLSQKVSGKSAVFESPLLPEKKNALLIETYTLERKIKNRKKKIKRDIDIWFIKLNSLKRRYSIYKKQRSIFTENEEIVLTKEKIGAIRSVEVVKFMIEKNDFELRMKELIREFIELNWEFQRVCNISIDDFLTYNN